MNTRILSDSDIRELLPMEVCIGLMEEALQAASKDEIVVPLRKGIPFPDKTGVFGLMPALSKDPQASCVKVVNVTSANHGKGYDSHLGVILYFEGEYGQLRTILDASSITALRTAAASGFATKLLAREDARVLAMFGSGVQAREHVDAVVAVRPIERVLVSTLSSKNAVEFKKHVESKHAVEVVLETTPEAMSAQADIICTATSSKEPVLFGDWLRPGVHINAVGACVRPNRELDHVAVQRSKLFTDRKESILAEAGDFLIPLEAGHIQETHLLGEVGEVALGRIPGRQSDSDITLFKSLGFAAEDLAVARYLTRVAEERNRGHDMYIGGRV